MAITCVEPTYVARKKTKIVKRKKKSALLSLHCVSSCALVCVRERARERERERERRGTRTRDAGKRWRDWWSNCCSRTRQRNSGWAWRWWFSLPERFTFGTPTGSLQVRISSSQVPLST